VTEGRVTKTSVNTWCAGILTAVILTASPVAAQHEESLKAAHTRYVQLWMAGDVAGIDRGLEPNAVGFWADSASATDLQSLSPARRQQALRATLAVGEGLRITEINMKYRTFDGTGIVWGYYKVGYTDKQRSKRTDNWRTTEVYTKGSGQWQLASWHLSEVPGR
jgi:hypothetical protein